MSTKTIEQTPWTPTSEWLNWADTFDDRIGFRKDARTEDEVLARKRADEDPRTRGQHGHASSGSSDAIPWSVSTDDPVMPSQASWGYFVDNTVYPDRLRHPNRRIRIE